MSTDDEFARSLRERADAAVPAMSLDAAATLHRGRRRVQARHGWQVGSVVAAVGMVAVVIAPILPTPGPTSDGTAAQVAASTTPQPTGTNTSAHASRLWALVLAKAGVLQGDMARARAVPFAAATWDALAGRLDALVTEAEAIPGHEQHDGPVELGLFVFPEGYDRRSTEWIGWDDDTRVTITEDPGSHRLRMSFARGAASIADVVLPARGTGSLSPVVTHGGSHLLDGDVLTYEDEHGERFELDVVTHEWRVTPTAPADLATTGSTAVPTASDAPTAGATGTGDGHTVDITTSQRAQLDSLTAQAMSGTSAKAAGSAARRVEEIWIQISTTRHATGATDGSRDVVSAGLVPTQGNPTPAVMFVATKHAQWDGWVDGLPTVATAGTEGDGDGGDPTTTGEIRVVTGSGGYGDAFTLRGTGALTLERESGGVLTVRDAQGADHRFDLATMRWV